MMLKWIEHLTDFLIKKDYIALSDRKIYIYGFENVFYTIWSTAVLLLLGLVLKQFIAACIIVAIFYTLQPIGGGYHANTHLKCLTSMVIGLLVGLTFIIFKEQSTIMWTVVVTSFLVLLLFPVVFHPNKVFLASEGQTRARKSHLTTMFLFMITVSINIFRDSMLYAFSAAFLLSAISRIVGKYVYSQRGK